MGDTLHMYVAMHVHFVMHIMPFYFCIQATYPTQVINCGELLHKWGGGNIKNIDAIFKEARSIDAILMFDEAEALFGTRIETR